MYILGHVGVTLAGVRAVDPEADVRLPMLLSILPDLLDKPAVFLLPALVHGNTRGLAHTLLGAGVVLALLLIARGRPGGAMLPWACYLGHFILDRMWLLDGPAILFWPFLGPFPAWSPDLPHIPHLMLYNLAGEALGLALIARHLRAGRLLEASRV